MAWRIVLGFLPWGHVGWGPLFLLSLDTFSAPWCFFFWFLSDFAPFILHTAHVGFFSHFTPATHRFAYSRFYTIANSLLDDTSFMPRIGRTSLLFSCHGVYQESAGTYWGRYSSHKPLGSCPGPYLCTTFFFLFLFDFLIFLISLLFFFDITRYLAACFSFDCSFHCMQEHQALGEDWIRYRRKISGNKIRWK